MLGMGLGFIPHSGRGGLAGWVVVRSSFSTTVVVALAERYGMDFGGVDRTTTGQGRGAGVTSERATATWK